jgi:hypothetical protein
MGWAVAFRLGGAFEANIDVIRTRRCSDPGNCAKCDVECACRVIRQRKITNRGVQKPRAVVSEGFVSERVVVVNGISEGFKAHSRTFTLVTNCVECLKAYRGIGAAGSVGKQRLAADGCIWTYLCCSVSTGSTASCVFLERESTDACVFAGGGVAKECVPTNRRIGIAGRVEIERASTVGGVAAARSIVMERDITDSCVLSASGVAGDCRMTKGIVARSSCVGRQGKATYPRC